MLKLHATVTEGSCAVAMKVSTPSPAGNRVDAIDGYATTAVCARAAGIRNPELLRAWSRSTRIIQPLVLAMGSPGRLSGLAFNAHRTGLAQTGIPAFPADDCNRRIDVVRSAIDTPAIGLCGINKTMILKNALLVVTCFPFCLLLPHSKLRLRIWRVPLVRLRRARRRVRAQLI